MKLATFIVLGFAIGAWANHLFEKPLANWAVTFTPENLVIRDCTLPNVLLLNNNVTLHHPENNLVEEK